MSIGKIAIDERTDLQSYRRKTKDKSKNKDYSKKSKGRTRKFVRKKGTIQGGWGKRGVAGRRLSPAVGVESNEVRTRGILPPPIIPIL